MQDEETPHARMSLWQKELVVAVLVPAMIQLGVILYLGGQQVERIDTLEEHNSALVTSLTSLKQDYIERDRRLWERMVGVEKVLGSTREDAAALKATLKHIAEQLNRIENKVDTSQQQ
jgi:hypothetical protein